MTEARDDVDHHVARWAAFWKDDPAFVPEVEGALVRMGQILRHVRRADAMAFADAEDFTIEDYRTLHALMVQPYPTEASPAQLAESTHVTRAAMTSRLDRLAAAGLVQREVDPADRRRVIVRPTADGRAAWNRYIFEAMARDQHLLRALSPDDLVQLNALLRKVMLTLD
jgi:DNA-binding MarR family transcriptional regulator